MVVGDPVVGVVVDGIVVGGAPVVATLGRVVSIGAVVAGGLAAPDPGGDPLAVVVDGEVTDDRVAFPPPPQAAMNPQTAMSPAAKVIRTRAEGGPPR